MKDVRMPIMDGLEATRRIRKYEETCHRASINDIAPTQQGATAATSAPTDGGHRRRRRIPIIAVRCTHSWTFSILSITLTLCLSLPFHFTSISFLIARFFLIFVQISLQMTADALADNIQECAKHGMDNFIAKPVNLAELEKLLLHYVPIDNEI